MGDFHTDNRNIVSGHANGRVVQAADPVLLKPKGDPGVATHVNTSATIHNPAGTVFNRGTNVAHRQSLLGAGQHTPDVLQGQNVPIRDGDNSFLSWAKNVWVEGQNVVMHAVETGVNSLWNLLPPEVKNMILNGEKVVSGLTADHFVNAAKEDAQAMIDSLMSKDTLIALLQTAVLMGLSAIPVVGQIAGGVATALRIKSAIESVAGAAEELKAILDTWGKPMSPAQLEEARKKLASWLFRVGIAALLAIIGKGVGKLARKIKSRHNSREPIDVGTAPIARFTDCPCATGNPVIIAAGEKTLSVTDFTLPGDIPIAWARTYRSGDVRDGWFGQGWSHPLAVDLSLGPDHHVYHDEGGRRVELPTLAVGGEHLDAYERLTFCRPAADVWLVSSRDGVTQVFRRAREDLWRLPLSALEDRHGNRVVLSYPPPPEDPFTVVRPETITDAGGRILSLAWDDDAHLLSVTMRHPGGRGSTPTGARESAPLALARYVYSEDGDLVSVTNAAGAQRTYSFQNHVLVAYTDAEGARFRAEYDVCSPSGRVTRSWNEDTGEGLTFEYDDRNRRTHVIDGLGRRTTYQYDARRDVIATTGPDGGRTETPFNANGHPRGTKDPLGRETHLEFDSRGNLTSSIDTSGARTNIEYGELDLPIKLTDAMGSVWVREYDARGNVARMADPLGNVTRYAHDQRGRPIEVTDARGGVTRMEWDETGNLVRQTSGSGGQTIFERDALGRVARTVNAMGHASESVYDADGNLIEQREPDGAVHRYLWDREGRLLAYTDPLGRVTAYRYDALGRVLKRTDAAGRTLEYGYDTVGRLVALTNENGAIARFRYDDNDNLTEEVGFDGRVQRYVYDAGDDLMQRIEVATGVAMHFTRDADGRVIEKRADGDESSGASYRYDALGRLITADNAAAKLAFTYDALGRLLSESQTLDGMDPRTIAHRYDALGHRTQTTLPDGRALHFETDGSGRLKGLRLADAGSESVIVDIEHDSLDREVRRVQGALESRYEHDPMGRLVRHRASARAPTEAVVPIERRYRYDPAGELVERLDSLRGATRYTYDPTERILAAQSAQTGAVESFRFDPAGNLLDVAGDPIRDNRVRRFGSLRYVHDVRGDVIERMTSEEEKIGLSWSAQGLLARAVVKRGGLTQTTSYEYDALGRRTRKRDAFGVTVYLWEGDAMIESCRGQRKAVFLFEPDGLIPLATLQNGEVYWYHCDQLGTPQEVTDRDGRVVWAADYAVWGRTTLRMTGTDGPSSPSVLRSPAPGPAVARIQQPFRFLGQQLDEETGLHYNRFRYYDPAIGRFLTQDPIGLEGGENPFVYGPNPTGWIDPFGLARRRRRGSTPPSTSSPVANPNKKNIKKRPCDCDKWQILRVRRRCSGHLKGIGHVALERGLEGEKWFSKDVAGHASTWKMFEERNGIAYWVADLNEFGDIIKKHKGEKGLEIDLGKLDCTDVKPTA